MNKLLKYIHSVKEETLVCPKCGAVPKIAAAWLKMQYSRDIREIRYTCRSCKCVYEVKIGVILVAPPGSQEANKRGCKCPIIDNHYGDGIYIDDKTGERQYIINESCPLHGAGPERVYDFAAIPTNLPEHT